jgi:hypothetical protein
MDDVSSEPDGVSKPKPKSMTSAARSAWVAAIGDAAIGDAAIGDAAINKARMFRLGGVSSPGGEPELVLL